MYILLAERRTLRLKNKLKVPLKKKLCSHDEYLLLIKAVANIE